MATVFEPASEHGKAGTDELYRQAVELFNFHALPQEVYDTQVVFNLLPRFGENSKVSLAAVSDRIESHLTSLLAPLKLVVPSFRLVHAPVFHGYCMNLRIRFAAVADHEAVGALLEAAGFEWRRADVEPVSNTGIAGQSGIAVSDIARDSNDKHALWVWVAFDNLRSHADNVLVTAGLLTRGSKT